MATATALRTFTLASPHVRGDDVKAFQRDLTSRFDTWNINRIVADDGDYGSHTASAARDVCRGLGIVPETAMKHGVSTELRLKIRHPDRRSDSEKARSRSDAATRFRAKMRKDHKTAGSVVVAAGANKPGQPIQKIVLDYVGRMATRVGKPIVITTGTNHDKFTTTGTVSDHFTGHAADIGMIANGGSDDSPVGDRIMTAALIEAGCSPADAAAKAHAGGLFTLNHAGMRIQCIWKTNLGGNHHNHVHVGVQQV